MLLREPALKINILYIVWSIMFLILFIYFCTNIALSPLIKLRFNLWSHMDFFNVFTLLGLESGSRKLSDFIKKIRR